MTHLFIFKQSVLVYYALSRRLWDGPSFLCRLGTLDIAGSSAIHLHGVAMTLMAADIIT